jgi:hypothetical protein
MKLGQYFILESMEMHYMKYMYSFTDCGMMKRLRKTFVGHGKI